MNEIAEFTNDVIDQIGYYVYRLIDPRDGSTFYVGKGKGNRVFDHARGIQTSDQENEYDSSKLKTILEIHSEGLNVIPIIHRHGLDEKTAFAVEAALIDAYPGITNIQDGHDSDSGVMSAAQIQNKYARKTIEEFHHKCLLIKVRQQTIEDRYHDEPSKGPDYAVWSAIHWRWRVNPGHANQAELVLGVVSGVVKGVYENSKWIKEQNGSRFFFDEYKPAAENISSAYLNKLIPLEYRKQGMASPVLYTY
jgi:hypothetical protein